MREVFGEGQSLRRREHGARVGFDAEVGEHANGETSGAEQDHDVTVEG